MALGQVAGRRAGAAPDVEHLETGFQPGRLHHPLAQGGGGLGERFVAVSEHAVVEVLAEQKRPRLGDAVVMRGGFEVGAPLHVQTLLRESGPARVETIVAVTMPTMSEPVSQGDQRATADVNGSPVAPHVCNHDLRETLSCLRTDFAVNNSAISKVVLAIHRFGHLAASGHLPPAAAAVLRPLYRALDLVWCKLLAGAELGAELCAGPGLRLAHGARGVVVSDGVVIGSNVSLYHQTSIGWQETRRDMARPPVPVIEDDARIGTGARVMGGVRIGKGALVGANAVVFKDVPAGSTAAGNPARIVTPPAPSGS